MPSAEFSKERVQERVAHGGHDIPDETIVRRYPRTIKNLFELYAPLCDELFFYDNSVPEPKGVFVQEANGQRILDTRLFKEIQESIQSCARDYMKRH